VQPGTDLTAAEVFGDQPGDFELAARENNDIKGPPMPV